MKMEESLKKIVIWGNYFKPLIKRELLNLKATVVLITVAFFDLSILFTVFL